MQDELRDARKRMCRANELSCNRFNKKRKHIEFQQGDHLWLRVKPNRYSRLQEGRAKLSYRYVGPFPVERKILEVAYRLTLPKHWRLCRTFHVSLLKQFVRAPLAAQVLDELATPRELPDANVAGEPPGFELLGGGVVPELQTGNHTVTEGSIQAPGKKPRRLRECMRLSPDLSACSSTQKQRKGPAKPKIQGIPDSLGR